MAQAYGGLHRDEEPQVYLDKICRRLVENSEVSNTDWLIVVVGDKAVGIYQFRIV